MFNFIAITKQDQLSKLVLELYIIVFCFRNHSCNANKLTYPQDMPTAMLREALLDGTSFGCRALCQALPTKTTVNVVGLRYSWLLVTRKTKLPEL